MGEDADDAFMFDPHRAVAAVNIKQIKQMLRIASATVVRAELEKIVREAELSP